MKIQIDGTPEEVAALLSPKPIYIATQTGDLSEDVCIPSVLGVKPTEAERILSETAEILGIKRVLSEDCWAAVPATARALRLAHEAAEATVARLQAILPKGRYGNCPACNGQIWDDGICHDKKCAGYLVKAPRDEGKGGR